MQFFIAGKRPEVWIDHSLLNCSPIIGCSPCLQVGVTTNKAVMSLHVHILYKLLSCAIAGL